MSTVLPREEAVETIFSKILASPEASGRLSGVFYDHIDDDHRLTDNDRDHFLQVLFHAYQNGDISALLLELCGRSMFDLLREAYLIPKKFHGKAGENPVLLTDAAGELLLRQSRLFQQHLHPVVGGTGAHRFLRSQRVREDPLTDGVFFPLL